MCVPPVFTSPFTLSFIWLSGSSVHVGALFPTGYEPSHPLSAAFCVHLGLSESSESSETFLCHQCLSRFLVGDYLHQSEFSVGIYVFFWGDLHWEVSLHCISHLWGLLSFDSLICTNTFIFSGGRTNRTLHFHYFILSPSPSSAAPFNISLPISITRYPLLLSSQHPFHVSATEPSLIFCCPHSEEH